VELLFDGGIQQMHERYVFCEPLDGGIRTRRTDKEENKDRMTGNQTKMD
jgi:hypothetical protein